MALLRGHFHCGRARSLEAWRLDVRQVQGGSAAPSGDRFPVSNTNRAETARSTCAQIRLSPFATSAIAKCDFDQWLHQLPFPNALLVKRCGAMRGGRSRSVVFLGLGAFIVYSTWAAFPGNALLLRPLSFAVLFAGNFWRFAAQLFGPKPGWWPAWLPFSPALLVLWAPGRFSAHLLLLSRRLLQSVLGRSARLRRRRAAQGISRRAFVSAHHAKHSPLFPLPRAAFHPRPRARRLEGAVVHRSGDWHDFIWDRRRNDLVLAVNVVLLGGYTFGCHSLRHLVGGFLDEISKVACLPQAYRCVSCLNRRHMLWAWMSLFWVGFSDLYVRLCSMGIWHDWRLI